MPFKKSLLLSMLLICGGVGAQARPPAQTSDPQAEKDFSRTRPYRDFVARLFQVQSLPELYPGYRPAALPLILVYSADSGNQYFFFQAGKRVFTARDQGAPALELYNYYYPRAKMQGMPLQLPPQLVSRLEASGIQRALILRYNFSSPALQKLLNQADRFYDHLDDLRIYYILHENFHLHITLPKWIDKDPSIQWPSWDRPIDRKKAATNCYHGSAEIEQVYRDELAAIVQLFALSYAKPGSAQALRAEAKRFIALRQKRYALTRERNLSPDSAAHPMNCAEAEAIMELEEGLPDYIGQTSLNRLGMQRPEQNKAFRESDIVEPFYHFGALQLMMLESLNPPGMASLLRQLAGSKAYDHGIFAIFQEKFRD